jgi:hypothetical protein
LSNGYLYIINLKEVYEVARLAQEVTLTEAEEEIRTIVSAEKKPINAKEIKLNQFKSVS